jgi:hypothetical protein
LGGDRSLRPVIPVYIGYCAVFKVREEAQATRHGARDTRSAGHRRRAGLSKLSSMRPAPREARSGPPGSVDIPSPDALRALGMPGRASNESLGSPGVMPDGDPVALR